MLLQRLESHAYLFESLFRIIINDNAITHFPCIFEIINEEDDLKDLEYVIT